MYFSLPSFAKINWVLRIFGKRDDGLHEIFTVFQTISLHDTLHFEADAHLSLTCDDPNIPTDERNLVIKAAKAVQTSYGVDYGARIHLEKRIPAPGGLGGGSSNAAVTMIGLWRLWQIDPEQTPFQTEHLAAEIGRDVPFFLFGGTAEGLLRGDCVVPINDVGPFPYLLVVTPPVRIPTREAYAGLNAESLTKVEPQRILSVCWDDAEALYSERPALTNDFERSVFAAYPEIKRVKETLLELGAANAAMSGSGASVFAVFDKEETRQAAEKALDSESTWRKFAVSTISRTEYREALGL
jgi:4-diphosphocytidyl-2-C-methyl-D-erythritol kinase